MTGETLKALLGAKQYASVDALLDHYSKILTPQMYKHVKGMLEASREYITDVFASVSKTPELVHG